MEPSGAEAVSAPSLELLPQRSDTATREQSINRIEATLTGSEGPRGDSVHTGRAHSWAGTG